MQSAYLFASSSSGGIVGSPRICSDKNVSSSSRNRKKQRQRQHNGERRSMHKNVERRRRKVVRTMNGEGNGSRRMEQKSDLLLFFYASFVRLKCLLCPPHYSSPLRNGSEMLREKTLTGNKKTDNALCAFRETFY